MTPALATTPRDTVHREGTAQLYRFRAAGAPRRGAKPVLVVPSLINRWYVVDLREGQSLVRALVDAGHDVFCLDWGIPEDEDRFFAWDMVLTRLRHAVDRVRRITGADDLGVVGYCMGGTLSGIFSALYPEKVAALVNLLGPFDFSKAGLLGELVDARWFDPEAITLPGNLPAMQMQTGFSALRPTSALAKVVGLVDRFMDPKARDAFFALEAWAGDNIPFPGAAYVTYIKELYQENRLVKGEHYVAGKRVDLGRITSPVLTIVAEKDAICPPAAALGLNACCGATIKDELHVPGGHVGAVVGSRAPKVLYPKLADWLHEHLGQATHGVANAGSASAN